MYSTGAILCLALFSIHFCKDIGGKDNTASFDEYIPP